MARKLGSFELPTKLTKVEHTETDTYAMFVAEPFEPGFCHSIGNALRRILLGAIEGATLTNVKVCDAQHEFQAIPGIVEDVVEIIINLKRVLFKSDIRESQVLSVNVSGKPVVLARDIVVPAGVKILNPDHVICHLDETKNFWAEMRLNRGRGYRLADENKVLDNVDGGIPLDSAFSPVRLVKYSVESTRVGQATEFEKLVLEVTTDGRILPEDALAEAVAILRLHLKVFDHLSAEAVEFRQIERKDGSEHNRLQKLLRMSVNEIELSVRAANCLNNANILTVGELAVKTESEMLHYRNFGKKSLTEIRNRLEELGLSLGMKVDDYM
ncbi:MAG: DNA-directed RNA polymerase subunit alpha [Puniceicoccales bacterium]|jgi:DNA-directed RNA polymerase subunit alpha|nr:DNA-directed RNA polymerase subunit alpha [Puniceicoccales bacterium]